MMGLFSHAISELPPAHFGGVTTSLPVKEVGDRTGTYPELPSDIDELRNIYLATTGWCERWRAGAIKQPEHAYARKMQQAAALGRIGKTLAVLAGQGGTADAIKRGLA